MRHDPDQTIEVMSTYTAQAVGHRGRTVRLNGGKVPLATASAQLQPGRSDQGAGGRPDCSPLEPGQGFEHR